MSLFDRIAQYDTQHASRIMEHTERSDEEIRRLIAHIQTCALRSVPVRRIRFVEAKSGSRIFSNTRYFDQQTGACVSEVIHYDPERFSGMPASAFYALLWHEFGHGDKRMEQIEQQDTVTYANGQLQMPAYVLPMLNVKYDAILDANNVDDHPGLRGPYRALYGTDFPRVRDSKTRDPLLIQETMPQEMRTVAASLEIEASRPLRFLFAVKHEAYWHQEDEETGVPPQERPLNPFVSEDLALQGCFDGATREAAQELGNALQSSMARSKLFDRVIAPVYQRLLGERRKQVETFVQKQVQTSHGADLLRDLILSLLRSMKKKGGEASASPQQEGEESPSFGEEEGDGELGQMIRDVQNCGNQAKSLSDALMKAIEKREAAQQKAKSHTAKRQGETISKLDARHPQSDRFDKKAHGEKQTIAQNPIGPPQAKGLSRKSRGSGNTSRQSGASLSFVKQLQHRAGKSGASDEETYRQVRALIPDEALGSLSTNLTRLFMEDRLRITLTDLQAGQLPTARKREALQRRYQGDPIPAVREIRKTEEHYMGIDFIVANDHSGSMNGDPEQAAMAANTAIATVAMRVNRELARRMRRSGVSEQMIQRTRPLRYLGLLFSNDVQLMNARGWNASFASEAQLITEPRVAEEQFAIELFSGYRQMHMGGTNDYLAMVQAVYQAFGKTESSVDHADERVKVICFITDGCGYVDWMKQCVRYLHGVDTTFPDDLRTQLERLEPGCTERIRQRIEKYRDQIFVLGVGITSGGREGAQTFCQVFNEDQYPEENEIRGQENHHVAVIDSSRVGDLPRLLLTILRAKFGSPRFRRIRSQFHQKTKGGKRSINQ